MKEITWKKIIMAIKKHGIREFFRRWNKGIDKVPMMKKLNKIEGVLDEK